MKLNPDCIRDILIEIEERIPDIHSEIIFYTDGIEAGRLAKYSFPEIEYHLNQCNLSGYIASYKTDIVNNIHVGYLSPAGHQFLADIRSDNVWNHTKAIAGKIGSFSLDVLSKIAVGVVTELIKKQLAT